jgi:hypothetical protein
MDLEITSHPSGTRFTKSDNCIGFNAIGLNAASPTVDLCRIRLAAMHNYSHTFQ